MDASGKLFNFSAWKRKQDRRENVQVRCSCWMLFMLDVWNNKKGQNYEVE